MIYDACMDKSLLVFEKYVRSEVTKKVYTYWFGRFLKWTKIKDASGLLQLKDSFLQSIVEDYIMYIRAKISPNSMNPVIASLQLFFSMNDKVLNWQRIRRMIPEKVKKAGYMAYQTEDIKKMLEGEPLRNKALIHFLASTGMRVGGLEGLKLKHLVEMPENTCAVEIYPDTNSSYWCFLTSESCKIFYEYISERRKNGEYINGESPCFRTRYQVGIEKSRMMSLKSIHLVLNRIVKKIDRKKVGNRRYNFMAAHSIRKRYSTIVKSNANIPYSVGERLLGHQAYLDASYFRPTRENLWKEWKKIVNELVVDSSEREQLRAEMAEKKVEVLELGQAKKMLEMESKIKSLSGLVERLLNQKA